jgi:PKD domain-containing protein
MRGRPRSAMVAAIVAVVVGVVGVVPSLASPAGAAAPPVCTSPDGGGPMRVTPDCVDPDYGTPVVDSETTATDPVPHVRVSGHFAGTSARFSIYLPTGIEWEHRFYQLVYPLQDENATAESIAFGAASGAYTVQTNGGSGYRIDAAAAKFAETVAAEHYGWSGPIHGYIYGASGGSYQTIAAMENSDGVWDGAVPIVNGVPTSIPSNFFVRAFARFVLEDDAAQIADAVSPGGSGDPYAALDGVERAVLREVTRMGVPLRAWEDYRYVLGLDAPDRLLGFADTVQAMDPGYVDDFWSEPGYLGTEDSALGQMFRDARTPENETELALLSYHRHQVPTRPGFYAFDQFRDPDGALIYPQRPVNVGSSISNSVSGGGTHTGAITGKVILVDNLLDTDAFPWHGDWYGQQVRSALGRRGYDENFRLWYNDNADHIGPRTPRLIQAQGVVQQALRDVAAWAERGVTPPRSTRYQVADSQIRVPDNAAVRRGIQPTVDLTADNATRVDIAAGETVRFRARVQVPPHSGDIVATEWDFTGTGEFTESPLHSPRAALVVRDSFTYDQPGTYYPTLRVTAQRDSDPTTPFARVQNLGRARVVVH